MALQDELAKIHTHSHMPPEVDKVCQTLFDLFSDDFGIVLLNSRSSFLPDRDLIVGKVLSCKYGNRDILAASRISVLDEFNFLSDFRLVRRMNEIYPSGRIDSGNNFADKRPNTAKYGLNTCVVVRRDLDE